MKKVAISIFLVFIALVISLSTPYLAKAQDKQTQPIIQYDLAYPGILPDNSLYKLKVLRDKISLFLISDPLKKIDFYLLQTDKGILATAMLVDKNKIKLAEETALKAEHNYTLLVREFGSLSEKPNAAFFQRLKTASLKHQEVLLSIIKRVPADKQGVFKTVLEFSKRNLNQVNKFQNRRFFEE